jgi:hypothetical protein
LPKQIATVPLFGEGGPGSISATRRTGETMSPFPAHRPNLWSIESLPEIKNCFPILNRAALIDGEWPNPLRNQLIMRMSPTSAESGARREPIATGDGHSTLPDSGHAQTDSVSVDLVRDGQGSALLKENRIGDNAQHSSGRGCFPPLDLYRPVRGLLIPFLGRKSEGRTGKRRFNQIEDSKM